MANTKVQSSGNILVRWAGPGFAANWKKPTVAEVNATLDVTDSVSWSDFSFGNQASNQVSDPSIADTGNVQTRGFAQFGGTLSFFYPRAYSNAADANSNTVPSSAKPSPRLPSIRNFHAASSEVSRLWNATRKTDASVVNSTAIHKMPRLFETATSSIANT